MTKITKFPEDLDTNIELPDIDSDDLMDDVGIEHDVQHTLLNQAVIELQKKVGKNNSEDKNSLIGMLEYLFQYEITGSATFSKLTNEIEIEGIKSLKLDIGDVIEIYGSTKNDNLYTVEDVTDILDDKIIVNYEHRNGNGSLSLEDEAVNCKIKRVCKYWQAPLGLGQAWVDVSNTLVRDGNRTNTTNRVIKTEIVGYAIADGYKIDFYLNGVLEVDYFSTRTSSSDNIYGQLYSTEIKQGDVYKFDWDITRIDNTKLRELR